MAIIKKIPTVSNRFSALSAGAAISVIVLCMAATAAIAGWMPAHRNAAGAGDDLPPVSSAPEASPIAAPVAAPVAAPAPDRSMQPRVRRAAHVTSTT